jgi:hypothetical protein
MVSPQELMDFLLDFEDSLSFTTAKPGAIDGMPAAQSAA